MGTFSNRSIRAGCFGWQIAPFMKWLESAEEESDDDNDDDDNDDDDNDDEED